MIIVDERYCQCAMYCYRYHSLVRHASAYPVGKVHVSTRSKADLVFNQGNTVSHTRGIKLEGL